MSSSETPFDKLLSAMDSALSSTDGRSVFAAAASSLSVSLGLTRVASAVVALLDNGSIHVERSGDNASCAPFVRAVVGGEENVPPLDNSRDVVQMLRERTLEGRLSSVIESLVANAGLISNHYNDDAFLVDEKNAACLVAAARSFDNCDAKELINIRVGNNKDRVHVKARPDEAQITISLVLPKDAGRRRAKREALDTRSQNGSVISGCSGGGGGGSLVEEGSGCIAIGGGHENLGARPKVSILRIKSSSAAVETDTEASSGDIPQDLRESSHIATMPHFRGHRRTVSDSSIQVSFFDSASNQGASAGSPSNMGSQEMISPLMALEPPAGGWHLPRPESEEQTLASYIGSGSFSRHQAQLDRENAHIILAEAIIQSMNKLNFEARNGLTDSLPQPVPVIPSPPPMHLFSSTTILSHVDSDNGGDGEEERFEFEDDDVYNIVSDDGGDDDGGDDDDDDVCDEYDDDSLGSLSVNDVIESAIERIDVESCSSWSPVPIGVVNSNSSKHHRRIHSAETVALSLLSYRPDAQQAEPRVSDLEWLVGDGDTPQKVLPLPANFASPTQETKPIAPTLVTSPSKSSSSKSAAAMSEMEFGESTELRGSLEWAPPRAQLILKVHTKTRLFPAMRGQDFRCAGCSMRVEVKYMKTYRFCYYFGKFFCTSCHSGHAHVLPAKVVERWDFKEYPVSDFGRSVVTSLAEEPLFRMSELNPRLSRRVAKLRKAVEARREAALAFPYVLTCKAGRDEMSNRLMERVRQFSVVDPDVLSLAEMCSIRSGFYVKELTQIVQESKEHILACKTCHNLGHICEGCRSDDILFPFQVEAVSKCPGCYACYHRPCLENLAAEGCSKCRRMTTTREMKRRRLPEVESDDDDGQREGPMVEVMGD